MKPLPPCVTLCQRSSETPPCRDRLNLPHVQGGDMESAVRSVGSPSGDQFPAEERMLREDVVREMLARLARGEGIKRIAREVGVDRKTVKAWRARGGWRPRPAGRRRLDPFRSFIETRAPEVGLERRRPPPR